MKEIEGYEVYGQEKKKGFGTKLNSKLSQLGGKYKQWKAEAPQRETRRAEIEKSRNERMKGRLELQRERLSLQQQREKLNQQRQQSMPQMPSLADNMGFGMSEPRQQRYGKPKVHTDYARPPSIMTGINPMNPFSNKPVSMGFGLEQKPASKPKRKQHKKYRHHYKKQRRSAGQRVIILR